MLTIRPLTARDIAHALRLSDDAGWNQTDADWRRFLSLGVDGCFAACVADQVVGTVTTCQFQEVGWIGMMLVHTDWRRQGIGRALCQRAVDSLESREVTTIRLDATPLGVPLYSSLGFREEFLLDRYAGKVGPVQITSRIRPGSDSDLDLIVAVDRQAVGYDRRRLLSALRREVGHQCVVDSDGASLAGYGMSRPGLRATFLGPCIAEHEDSGRRILRSLLNQHFGQPAYVDIPQDNRAATETVVSSGLAPARRLLRMTRGERRRENLGLLFASSGPEKG